MKVSELLLLNIFPDVTPSGCFFHYAKSKWERVKKMVWQNSTPKTVRNEPKFGNFVRLVIGLPKSKKLLWNKSDVLVRTNNQAEGYNYALDSKS